MKYFSAMITYVFNVKLFFSYTFLSLILTAVIHSQSQSRNVGEQYARGWSQEVLSDFAEIHRTHLSAIERGERRPSLDTFCRISHALGVGPAVMIDAIEVEIEAAENSKEDN